MAITRITQNMMTRDSLASLQANLSRTARLQEQMSTGRVINRPSDSPTGAAAAMRLRDDLAATGQYQRNTQDGVSWLGIIDNALTSVTDQTREARDTALQGASAGTGGQGVRDGLAGTIDELRKSLLADANTTYLGRPVFGGTTAGSVAYDGSGAFVGTTTPVTRTVADGVTIRVDADATAVFGADGANVFSHLSDLSTALRAGDQAGIAAGIDHLNKDLDRLATAHAEVGTRAARVDAAAQTAADTELRLKSSLSNVENADLPQVIVDLQMQQTSYQAALAATSRVMQPSLLDFLR
ncbi:flagellin [Marmoricola sp. URHB0036]|uniref:flagellin N-terminal helical domain-containing protein n=1 Tax=Marmoricola sp. URHB0036 TaxID=1298863 RepID=UPI00040C32AF|nr:flagellin [Marmoricola sp. URHB0036]